MMTKEQEIYSKLYDVTSENMQNAGKEIPFTKDAFLYSAKRNLKVVDMLDLAEFDRATFLQALYIGFLFRTPEERARIDWGNVKLESTLEYQRRAFKSLSLAPEAVKNGVNITNNIFGDPIVKIGMDQTSTTAVNYWYVEKLYGYYGKIPAPLRKILKSLLKR